MTGVQTCALPISGADQPYDYILGYLGSFRILISDLVVLTMCEEPLASPAKVEKLKKDIRELNPSAEVVATVLRPKPDGDIRGRRVAYFTTAQGEVVDRIAEYISSTYGCTVDFISTELADRRKLRQALSELGGGEVDIFLTEIKAAAVDVVAEEAARRGTEVVFCDNVPMEVDGDERLGRLVIGLAEQAIADFS